MKPELRCVYGLVLLAALAIGGLVTSPADAAPRKKAKGDDRPNILFIMTDQHFAEAMSCVDPRWISTPGMDSLAARGVRFPNTYVNHPVCLPQRYTMLTGRLPCTRRQADADNKPTISLGNQARSAGYDTAYFGKWHIQDSTFERKDAKNTGFPVNAGGNDPALTTRAIDFLSKRDPKRSKKPLFLVMSLNNPHDICQWGRAKAGYTNGIKMKNGEVNINPPLKDCPPLPDNYAISADEAEAVAARRKGSKRGKPNAQKMAMDFTDNDWRQYRWAYNRCIELADEQISRMLKALDTHGYADNTVVIYTSDHGDGDAAHRWHQKSILYEESVRVPLMICLPDGKRQGETDPRLISIGIDLMATVSDIAGAKMPEGPYYGISALPFVKDADSTAPTHQYVVSEAEVRGKKGGNYDGRSVRTERFKYHAWDRGENREQLFDMLSDPGETNNLAKDPAFAEQMALHRSMLNDWLDRTDDTYKGPRE